MGLWTFSLPFPQQVSKVEVFSIEESQGKLEKMQDVSGGPVKDIVNTPKMHRPKVTLQSVLDRLQFITNLEF